MMTLICPNCQRKNRGAAIFCAGCGIKFLSSTMPLQPGQLMRNGDYRILRTLGKGGMGVIYLAENLQAFGRFCVIKEMLDYFDPTKPQEIASARKRFKDEARTLAQLHHPGIPNIHAFFSEGSHNYIVMEYVEGMSLEQGVTRTDDQGQLVPAQPLSPELIVQIGVQLCQILEYLAQLKPPVVHHDIKPANIIIEQNKGQARLVDFGTAKSRFGLQAGGQVGLQQSSIYGTEGYAPPEQYKGESEGRSDVYALAATLYHLLSDDDPSEHPFSFPKLARLPLNLMPVLRAALESNVKHRSSATQFKEALKGLLTSKQHPTSPPSSAKIGSKRLNPRQHQSFAFVATQGIPNTLRGAVIQLLQAQFGLSEVDAEIITWQVPASLAKGLNEKEAEIFEDKVKRLGVRAEKVLTSQLVAWRAGLFTSDPQLLSEGEMNIKLSDIPPDRLCHCYRCGHEWKTRAKKLLKKCPRCKSPNWTQHRLFQCAVCGHQFTHGNLHKSAKSLFPECSACHTLVWRPQEQPELKSQRFEKEVGQMAVNPHSTVEVVLSPPNGPALRGRAVADQPWLKIQPSTFNGHRIQIEVDGSQLTKKNSHLGNVQIISNGGSAVVALTIHMDHLPLLNISHQPLDFGMVKASQQRKMKLIITNRGGQQLQGTISGQPTWLELSQTTFQGDKTKVWLTVFGHKLPLTGQNSVRLKINSNGGSATILIVAHAIFPQLTVSPAKLDFGFLRASDIRTLKFSLNNSGGQLLQGRISARSKWLHVSQSTFEGNNSELEVTVNGRLLPTAGVNDAILTVKSNGGSKSIKVMARALPPQIQLNPSELNFGTLTPQKERTLTLVVSNRGGQLLQGLLSKAPDWLHVDGPHRKNDHIEFGLTVRGRDLPRAGVNRDQLTINSNGGSASVEVEATTPPTLLIANPRELDLGQQPHRIRPKGFITLSNPGFGTLNGQVASSESWLTVEPARFQNNTTQLTLIANTSQLAHGKRYSAKVTIISNGGREVIPVQIEVDPAGRIAYNLQHNWRWRVAVFLVVLAVFCIGLALFTLS